MHGRVLLAEDDDTAIDPPDLDLPPPREVADELLLVSRWLEQAKGIRCELASGVAASRLFPSGYAVMRSGWTPAAHQLIADAGPLCETASQPRVRTAASTPTQSFVERRRQTRPSRRRFGQVALLESCR